MMKINIQREWACSDTPLFASCHASTVWALPDGTILAAWFAGTREGHGDVGIWISRRTEEGWEPPERVAGEPGVPHWNPVFFQEDGELFLFYKVGQTIPGWDTRLIRSQDVGRTWSSPEKLEGANDLIGRGPVRNHPIRLNDGAWLAPASVETTTQWDAFTDRSEDKGHTWKESAHIKINHDEIKGRGIIQPTLWEDAAGVHMLLRSTDNYIYRSDSTDQGRSWSPAYRTELLNNNSGIDLAQLDDGTLFLVHNPVDRDSGKRTPLVVSRSTDDGGSWETLLTLEKQEGEYSYPSIVAQRQLLHVTYTWNRKRIAYWEVFCPTN
ncbi:sialidase family protein [Aureibacillus halotolerans]|uniref:Putative neuraminidase n=1 Tax=Aureibacillus halotolerans TaxID=1508390 RepID=A0A4R6UAQ4_9BACI|nr:sialidase family protein [Aureibacillus halotolerans]TDQ42972.1 putative neuraminidase [Aureibacillus halotolerans]